MKPIPILIGILFAVGFIFYIRSQQNEVEAGLQDNVLAACSATDSYVEDPDYMKALIEECHPRAFGSHYVPRGRRRPARLDESGYYFAIFAAMEAKASADGRPTVADDVRKAQSALQLALAKASLEAQ